MPVDIFYSQILFFLIPSFFIKRQGLNLQIIIQNLPIYTSNRNMGNKFNNKKDDEFIRAVSQMKRKSNEFPVQKVSTHLQERYKTHMIETLKKHEMSKSIKKILAQTIEIKIKKEELTSTVSVLNSLRSNNAELLLKSSVSLSNSKGESKNVVVKFNNKLKSLKSLKNKEDGENLNQFMPYREEDTIEGRIKHTGNFITKQLNKPYHPFRILCKKFGDILGAYQQSEKQSHSQNQYEIKQDLQRKTIKQFCQYLVVGCIGIYRKWIVDYTGMEDNKYDKWMNSLVLNQIWTVNDNYLLAQILKIISKTRVPLKIDFQGLITSASMGLLQPKDFAIDEQLQIEGNYLTSIYEMCVLTQKKKPSQMLKQLQIIKNNICLDIDNYHKLCEKGQIFEVNGDNIMGIVAYILSKNAPKINQISERLLFLKVLYGEGIYYNMDTSSYMYSTIWGAIEYLESKKFYLHKESNSTNEVDKTLKDTSCVQSFVSDLSTNNATKTNNLNAV